MERRNRHHDEAARNPQRRPVLTFAAGRRVPTEGNDNGSGAVFRHYHSVNQSLGLTKAFSQTSNVSEGLWTLDLGPWTSAPDRRNLRSLRA